MPRRNRIQLTITFIAPLLVVLVGVIDYYFSASLLSFVKVSYFLGVLALVFLFLTSFRRKSIGELKHAEHSAFLWLLKIFAIELGMLALCLMLKQVLLIGFVNGQEITIGQGALVVSHFFDDFLLNYYLYPLPLLLTVAVIFAYANSHISIIAPFSTFMPKRLFNPFVNNFIKASINVYIHLATRLFLSLNLIIIVYYFCLFIGDRFVLFQPIGGIISGLFLSILFTSKSYRNVCRRYNEKGPVLGKLFIRFFISVLVITLITQILAQILIKIASVSLPFDQFKILQTGKPFDIWQLMIWAWWILAIPFMGSLLIRVSRGRRVFTFLVGALILPVILLGILGYLHANQMHILSYQIIMNWILLGASILAMIFFFWCLFLKGHQSLMQIGAYSLKPMRSKRRLEVNTWWHMPVCIVVFLGLGGIDLLQWMCMLVALPCFLIFVLFAYWGIFKK